MIRPKSHNGVCIYEEDWTYCRKCAEFIRKTSSELRIAKNKALIHDECGKQVSMRSTKVSAHQKHLRSRGVKWID